jgi:hypothetical protein
VIVRPRGRRGDLILGRLQGVREVVREAGVEVVLQGTDAFNREIFGVSNIAVDKQVIGLWRRGRYCTGRALS